MDITTVYLFDMLSYLMIMEKQASEMIEKRQIIK